jgi:hypothetical protein
VNKIQTNKETTTKEEEETLEEETEVETNLDHKDQINQKVKNQTQFLLET